VVSEHREPLTAPALVRHLSDAITGCSTDLLEDDATVVAFSPSSRE
jgi:hypothetical protein